MAPTDIVASVAISVTSAASSFVAIDAVVLRQVDESARHGAVRRHVGHHIDLGVAMVTVLADDRRVVVVGLDVARVTHRVVRRVGHHLHSSH